MILPSASPQQQVLHDPRRCPGFDPIWFEAEHWRGEDRVLLEARGRGKVLVVDSPIGPLALRHYRRGGLVARLLGDRYLWSGAAATRGFAEYRLLEALVGQGLPVPSPVAARYQRSGLFYRADLLTRFLPGCRTLAELLALGPPDDSQLQRIGRTLAEFHHHGVHHADLNAHNILVGTDGQPYLLDFDRGRLRRPAQSWQRATVRRLQRSVSKISQDQASGGEIGRKIESAWREALQQSSVGMHR